MAAPVSCMEALCTDTPAWLAHLAPLDAGTLLLTWRRFAWRVFGPSISPHHTLPAFTHQHTLPCSCTLSAHPRSHFHTLSFYTHTTACGGASLLPRQAPQPDQPCVESPTDMDSQFPLCQWLCFLGISKPNDSQGEGNEGDSCKHGVRAG